MSSGQLSQENGTAVIRKPKAEQNISFTRTLHWQNCSLIYALPSLVHNVHGCMHMVTERCRDFRAVHHDMAFSKVSWLFLEQLKQLGLPVAAHLAFSKSAVSCLGLFKLTFFLFAFILLFVIKSPDWADEGF